MIYTAYIKSDDRGISRGIIQGTREVKPNEKVFYNSENGIAYILHGEKLENLKCLHLSNLGGDSTYFVHILYEKESYNNLEEILNKFQQKEVKNTIIKKEKKEKGV